MLCLCEGIGTRDGTAKKDKDFKGKAQKQFNPGQTRATWRVRILERRGTRAVRDLPGGSLRARAGCPGVLAVTTVEIVDPGDGKSSRHLARVVACRFLWQALREGGFYM